MNTEDYMWTLQNQIHELRLQISTSNHINYEIAYKQLTELENEYRTLKENERD